MTTGRPIGYFVHHQGRGHAERCAAIVNALPRDRPVRIFCAQADIFPALPANATITAIPSLFEPDGSEAPAMSLVATPETLHCAPLGWPGIRRAMATLTGFFAAENPVLMICDVSAEIAQLARICSVPHIKILQHGNRGDAGHQAAYDGAVGLIAPYAEALAQPEWSAVMRARTCFAGGLGVDLRVAEREVARQRIGVASGEQLFVVLSGGGGTGFAQAPIAVGARAFCDARWITIGQIAPDWHATESGNVEHRGWVDNAADYIAAADLVVASTGNTTCQQILAAARPWLAVPEWRYFDEQVRKADALAAAGVAVMRRDLPSSADDWRTSIAEAFATHDPQRQRSMIADEPARETAAWLETLIARLWSPAATPGERVHLD
ncbi:glycosyltransferase [Glacieibacterium sp.]|uniref:glycosyltransferase n=1 Tax=Glacieibacterium sp. TaxID=2860237 RepID=UPI003AFFF125